MTLLLALAVALSLEQQIARLDSEGLICDADAVRTFYGRRAYAPAWNDASLAALTHAIENAPDDALDPRDYHETELRTHTGLERDVLATDAFLAFGGDLSRGRIDPESLDRRWCSAPRSVDLPAMLFVALEDGTIGETLQRLAPRHEAYQRLRRALQVYRAMSDWSPLAEGKSLRRGVRNERVAQLRARFGLAGGDAFDAALDAAVRDFQKHHGLAEDGIVGPKTLRELNVPRAKRVQQIALNLERWRWMPPTLGEPHLIVNIAAFQLDLMKGDRSVLSMRIVAGKEYTRTPFFSAAVERVIVNPAWRVPDSIASKEVWPKQRRDPDYFAREHMYVAGGRVIQRPGPWCALGRVKFDMPNRFNVYLHDTPARTLFARDLRAFSHGCIRLEKPFELAVALTGRTRDELEAITAPEHTIPLATKVPVYVLYWTAFVADDGHVEFRRDVYGRDAVLEEELAAKR